MRLLCIGDATAVPALPSGFAGNTFSPTVRCRRLLPEAMTADHLAEVVVDPLPPVVRRSS